MRAIGVAEIADYLSGDLTLDEAIMRGAQATRNYAKRQYTWLRHQPPPIGPALRPESHENSDIARHFDRLLQQ
jgi:tRNA dimethylallyltransferase